MHFTFHTTGIHTLQLIDRLALILSRNERIKRFYSINE